MYLCSLYLALYSIKKATPTTCMISVVEVAFYNIYVNHLLDYHLLAIYDVDATRKSLKHRCILLHNTAV